MPSTKKDNQQIIISPQVKEHIAEAGNSISEKFQQNILLYVTLSYTMTALTIMTIPFIEIDPVFLCPSESNPDEMVQCATMQEACMQDPVNID